MVNKQHHILGEIVSNIRKRFDNVHSLSKMSSDKSIRLHEKGQGLLESMAEMVKLSGEGKENLLRQLKV